MINEEFAAKQIDRLSGLRGFPTSIAAGRELVTALMGARTEALAEQAVSGLMDSECPRPGDIRRVVWDLNERHPAAKGDACLACDGSGWVVSYWLVTQEHGYKRRERLPFTDYLSYSHYLDGMRKAGVNADQSVISAVTQCNCTPRSAPLAEETKRRKKSA